MKGIRFLLLTCFVCVIALPLLASRAFAVHEDALSDLQERVKKLEEVKVEEKKVDFGGFIRTRFHISNFATFNAGQILPPDKTVQDADHTANFAEERARLYISPKLSQYVSGTFAFEFDMRFGDSAYGVGRNQGGGLESDQINIETKDIFFTVNFPGTALTGIFGLQNIKDPYNGLVLGWADTGGVTFKYAFSKEVNALAGWYRFFQPTAKIKRSVAADFYRAEVDYTPSKELDLGFNLYSLLDRTGVGSGGPGVLGGPAVGSTSNGFAPLTYNVSTGHESLVGDTSYKMSLFLPGVNFKYKVGNYTLEGFFIYDGGKFDANTEGVNDVTISSFATNLAVSAKVGSTDLKLSGIYVTGDNGDNGNPTIGVKKHGFYGPGQYSFAGAWMGTTGMKILFPDIDATNQDAYLVYDVSNILEQRPLGITTVLLTSNTKLTDKLNLEAGLGFLWSSKDRIVNHESYMGTELNAGLHYQVTKGLSVGVVGAYAWVGDFFKVTDAQAAAYNANVTNHVSPNNNPADMWRTYVRANYSF
jgi:hypothetical protein